MQVQLNPNTPSVEIAPFLRFVHVTSRIELPSTPYKKRPCTSEGITSNSVNLGSAGDPTGALVDAHVDSRGPVAFRTQSDYPLATNVARFALVVTSLHLITHR